MVLIKLDFKLFIILVFCVTYLVFLNEIMRKLNANICIDVMILKKLFA